MGSRAAEGGVLDYALRRFDPEVCDHPIRAVGVNYDWVLEDHSLLNLAD